MPVMYMVNDMEHGTPQELIVYLLGQDRDKEFEIKPYKQKRSNEANAYYQTLLDQLANVLNLPRDEVHRQMLEDYGTLKYNDDGTPYVHIRYENEALPKDGDYYFDTGVDVAIIGYKGDKDVTRAGRQYKVIRGSHTYKSDEMARLIRGLVQECEQQDIETRTPQEIELMIQQMKDKENGQ